MRSTTTQQPQPQPRRRQRRNNSSVRIWHQQTTTILLVYLLSFLILPANSQVLGDAIDREESNDVPFHEGGTDPICWEAEANAPLVDVNDIHFVSRMVILDACPANFKIGVVVDRKTASSERPPKGWTVPWKEAFKVRVRGEFPELGPSSDLPNDAPPHPDLPDRSATAALVLQLCPVGLNTFCLPIVPPKFLLKEPKQRRVSFQEKLQERQRHLSGPEEFHEELGSTVEIHKLDDIYEDLEGDGVEFELVGASPGTYSILATVVFSRNGTKLEGWSNIPLSTDEQLVTFMEESVPLAVTDTARKCVIAFSSIGGAILLFLLYHTCRNRRAQVFELTQGKFLIAMLLAALLATCSLVVFEPRNDLYCVLPQPLIILPLHIMYAILLGRMWRIRAVISPLLLLTLEKREHWTTKCVNCVHVLTSCGSVKEGPRKKIRMSITDLQLARVIAVLILPQIVIQVLILTLQDNELTTKYYDDFEDGIKECRYSVYNSALELIAMCLVFFLFVMLVVLAQASKDLPSLFNETRCFLDVTWVTMTLAAVGTLFGLATRTEDTKSNVQFLVITFSIGVTTTYTCFKIIWPKLVVAWRGDTVMVTKLIADHNFAKTARRTQVGEPYSFMTTLTSHPTYSSDYSHGSTTRRPSSITRRTSNVRPSRVTPPPMLRPSTIASAAQDDPAAQEDLTEFSMNHDTEEDLVILEEGSDEEDADSTDSSVILMEAEGHDAFPFFGADDRQPSVVSDSNNTNDANRRGSSAWRRMQSAVANQLGLSKRDMSTATINTGGDDSGSPFSRAPSAYLAPPSSGGGSRFIEALSPTNIIAAVAGGRPHKRNERVISRRALFTRKASDSTLNSNGALSTGPRGNRDSLVRNTGMQNARVGRSQMFGRKSVVQGVGGGTGPNRPASRTSLLLNFTFGGGGGAASAGGNRIFGSTVTPQPTSAGSTIEYNPRMSKEKIRISDTEPPGRRLLLRMIDVQRMLSKVNQALLTGLSVDRQDWEEIRDGCCALGDAFTDEVVFSWEALAGINEKRHDEEAMDGGDDEEDERPPRPPRKAVGSKRLSWKPELMESPPFLKKDGGPPTEAPMSVTHYSMTTIDSMESGQSSTEVVGDASPQERICSGVPAQIIARGVSEQRTDAEVSEQDRRSSDGSNASGPGQRVSDGIEPLESLVRDIAPKGVSSTSLISSADSIDSIAPPHLSSSPATWQFDRQKDGGMSGRVSIETIDSEMHSSSFMKQSESSSLSNCTSLSAPRRGIRSLASLSPQTPSSDGTSLLRKKIELEESTKSSFSDGSSSLRKQIMLESAEEALQISSDLAEKKKTEDSNFF